MDYTLQEHIGNGQRRIIRANRGWQWIIMACVLLIATANASQQLQMTVNDNIVAQHRIKINSGQSAALSSLDEQFQGSHVSYFTSDPLSGETLSTSFFLYWSGGSPNCSYCVQGNLTSGFACSDSRGAWDDGIKAFNDPLPAGSAAGQYIVTGVTATLWGTYQCSFGEPATIYVLLDGIEVTDNGYQVKPGETPVGCLCGNCDSPVTVSKAAPGPDGWGGYVYGGKNFLQVLVEGNSICLHGVEVGLNYSAIAPVVFSLTPPLGPTTGGTNVTVSGQFSPNATAYVCRFSLPPDGFPILVAAEFVGDNYVNCTAPVAPSNGTADVDVSADGYVFSTACEFVYYMPPNITAIVPTRGSSTGGTHVTVLGHGFVQGLRGVDTAQLTLCRFGEIAMPAQVHGDGNMTCEAPPGAGNVTVEITFNGQQWTWSDMAMFTYSDDDDTGGHGRGHGAEKSEIFPSYLGWVIAGAVVVTFTAVVSGILIWMRNKRRLLYQAIPSPATFDALAVSGGKGEYAGKLAASLASGSDTDVSEIQFLERIGKGSFGEVYKAYWRGTLIAVKKLPAHYLSDEFYKEFEREAALMRKLRHPNVLQFLGACLIPPDLCILTEYMPKGSLYRILHDSSIKLDWELVRKIALDAAKGMNYLHCSDPPIFHRDIKSHNLLVDEYWRCKVCDFGLSRIVENSGVGTMTACGTPCWTAPEVLRNQRYTEKADVYGFGVVLWEMVTREDPYHGMPPFQVVFAVGTQGLRPTIPETCPPRLTALIQRCWAEDPKERPSFQEIIGILEKTTFDTP